MRPDAWSKPKKIRICPSILSADFARLGEEIERVERAGADFLHIDIMDGQFVRNITFGPILVEAMRRLSTLPFDVHLMIVDPLRFLEPFAKAGADHVIVHEETVPDLREAARAIRALGLKAGGVVKPGTPIERLIEALPDLDIALVMTVEPGKGGQPFLEDSPGRIARVREAIDRGGYDCLLQVDGGIAEETIVEAERAGADTFVAGHSIFRTPDPERALKRLRAAAERA
ncbi:MAG TPA: ribulose-phosphate 3-epimerase [Candidatus Nitrosocosmicus sp.]|nr:ribulose-phosphate 3-epimerase [Candidatus Nitrosocosmicus sp.]